ncbi:MAG: AAA family ATPase [Clostridiales bacterium]|nr:AAA family ATPase [Candidatus Blautia equi]
MSKMPSVIRTIHLNQNTYHGVTIEPTLVNFFYGKNGVGKSTLTRVIQNQVGISPVPENQEILVFNTDFINENIRVDDAIPGLFTMSHESIEQENLLQEKEARQTELEEEDANLKERKSVIGSELQTRMTAFYDACWNLTAQDRGTFRAYADGKRITKKALAQKLTEIHEPFTDKYEDLENLYQAAFSTDDTVYPQYTTVLAKFQQKNLSLLSQPILSSSDSPFAAFIRNIGATDWVHQGHDQFAGKAKKICPYCNQPLPKDYSEQFSAVFDEQYKKDIRAVEKIADAYTSYTGLCLSTLKGNLDISFSLLDTTEYREKLDTLQTIFELNHQKLKQKLASPSSTVTLEDTYELLKEIGVIISRFNEKITCHNEAVKDRETSQKAVLNKVWVRMASLVSDERKVYTAAAKPLIEEGETILARQAEIKAELTALKAEIKALSKEVASLDPTIDSINERLEDYGFTGFRLRKDKKEKNKFRIVRGENEAARGLSEGEKNFLGFLYFYYKIFNQNPADAERKEKIIVIDDPISSMDSSSIFHISSMVRDLIDKCLLNAKISKTPKTSTIRQLFVLTHNAFFHRQITYDKLMDDNFDFVNSYLITKERNVSAIHLCIHKDPDSDAPARERNYSPVQNTYAALWKEYRDTTSVTGLQRIMRQILDYYFIQISGHAKTSFNKMVEEKLDAMPEGSESQLFADIRALLGYVYLESLEIDDGFDNMTVNPRAASLRKAFMRIFELMGQKQHYDMMMSFPS